MTRTQPQLTGYAVTVEVFVPLDVVRRTVDRLDAAWHIESWTPDAASFVAARDALYAAGLRDSTRVSTREVTR